MFQRGRGVCCAGLGLRDGRCESRAAALDAPGSKSRGGGGAAGSSRAGREFPGAGQRERQRRVRPMRAVRQRFTSLSPLILRFYSVCQLYPYLTHPSATRLSSRGASAVRQRTRSTYKLLFHAFYSFGQLKVV